MLTSRLYLCCTIGFQSCADDFLELDTNLAVSISAGKGFVDKANGVEKKNSDEKEDLEDHSRIFNDKEVFVMVNELKNICSSPK